MNNQLEEIENGKDIQSTTSTSPKEAMIQARERAQILTDLVRKSSWSSNIGGKNHLHFEAWQTLGRFYDCTAKTVKTTYVEYGNVVGFEASAVVVDRYGKEIGAAESICMQDEPNWKEKPLYSLKSMAQTRACAKALRQVFGWVAVLAGYSATPFEEMDGIQPAPRPMGKPTTPSKIQTGRKPTPPQINLIKKLQSEGTINKSVEPEKLTFKGAWELINRHAKK